VLVRRGGEDVFVPASEVVPHGKGRDGDFVIRPVVHREISKGYVDIVDHPRAKSKIDGPLPVDEALAAWLGFYVAEGHVSQGKVIFTFASHEEDTYGREVVSLSQRLFGKVPSLFRRAENNSFVLTMGQSSVAEWVESTCGNGAENKHVPAFLLKAPRPVVGAFLRSLFNGDGHDVVRSIGLTSKSEVLIHQVRALCSELGVSMSFAPASRGCFQLRGFGANADVFRASAGWGSRSSCRRATASLVDNGLVYSRVFKSCLRSYDGPVLNFHVEDDERYVCGSMCVHNCKQTIHASLSVKWAWLTKITREASALQKEPALAIEIQGGKSDPLCDRDWVLITARTFERLCVRCDEN